MAERMNLRIRGIISKNKRRRLKRPILNVAGPREIGVPAFMARLWSLFGGYSARRSLEIVKEVDLEPKRRGKVDKLR
jgi:hypothetical protein